MEYPAITQSAHMHSIMLDILALFDRPLHYTKSEYTFALIPKERVMTKPVDELLLVSCVDYLLEYGGLAFIEFIISVKEEKRRLKHSVDPSVFDEPLSLDLGAAGDDSALVDTISDDRKGPMEMALDRSTVKFVDALVDNLRPKEREVICMRFGLRGHDVHTLESAGIKLGVTRERVRQIEASALKRLQKRLEAKGVSEDIL